MQFVSQQREGSNLVLSASNDKSVILWDINTAAAAGHKVVPKKVREYVAYVACSLIMTSTNTLSCYRHAISNEYCWSFREMACRTRSLYLCLAVRVRICVCECVRGCKCAHIFPRDRLTYPPPPTCPHPYTYMRRWRQPSGTAVGCSVCTNTTGA